MRTNFSTYNYTPLFNLKKSDFIDLRSNLQEFIPFGEDNLLPTQLNKLAREVPVHRAILNAKTNYIVDKSFASTNDKIKAFVKRANTSESFNTVFKKIVLDYLTHGNAWLEVVTNAQKSILLFYHMDASKVRFASTNDGILIHPDWETYKGKNDPNTSTLPLYPFFQKGKDGLYHSIYHIKDYEPEFYYYGLCSYFPGLRSIIITGLANIWNQSRLENQFSAQGLLVIPGVNSTEEADLLNAEFEKFKGAGAEKANDIIIQYLSDPAPGTATQEASFVPFDNSKEANWVDLHRQAEMSLITIHNWYRTLTPYSNDKTGFDTNRIINEYEIAMSSIIKPHQEMFLEHFKKLFTDFNFPEDDFEILNEPPVTKINPFKFIWEVRRDSGLDYDPTDPVQKQLVLSAKNTFISDIDTSNNPL